MELLDELTGHLNGVCSIAFAGLHIYTGSYDHTIRSWDYNEMIERIDERKKMLGEHFYSLKSEKYKQYLHKHMSIGKLLIEGFTTRIKKEKSR